MGDDADVGDDLVGLGVRPGDDLVGAGAGARCADAGEWCVPALCVPADGGWVEPNVLVAP